MGEAPRGFQTSSNLLVPIEKLGFIQGRPSTSRIVFVAKKMDAFGVIAEKIKFILTVWGQNYPFDETACMTYLRFTLFHQQFEVIEEQLTLRSTFLLRGLSPDFRELHLRQSVSVIEHTK